MKNALSLLMLLAFCGAAARGTAQVTFSPAAGTYSGSQSVSISCNPSSGTTIWYTTNGYPANTGATQYTGPISVSGTTTISAICAKTGAYDAEVNPQGSTANWKCNAPNAPVTSNGWTCETSGGVSGSLSSFDFTVGSPAYMVASTEASGPTNALLFIHTPPTQCDTCTTITEHLDIKPDQGTSVITRNEMDMEQCCDTTTSALHQASLQCNGSVWEINASGSWEPTTIACDLPTSAQTDVVYEAQWVNGDTGCGGSGCMYLNALTINGARYFP
ncbi:MAG: chitobiase/beta-hexosaminidase C-terminal domain-containing protein, partial [Acidobacteriaceae bacterium]